MRFVFSFISLMILAFSFLPTYADDVCNLFCQGQGHESGKANGDSCSGTVIGDCCCS